jgi:cell wall-associated NlpC family hydrolase
MGIRFLIDLPVVDLRSNSGVTFPSDYSHQEGRESQLLFGEQVELIEEAGEWLKIAALEQLCYREDQGWFPYPGWVKRLEVKQIEEIITLSSRREFCRSTLIADAFRFLGTPYLWGGRSHHLQKYISGVDCSGLINLLYRTQGVMIPRNCHDQFLASWPTEELLPGDPLYLAKEKRCNHVILKISHNQFIEAPETGKNVRLLTWGKEIFEEDGKISFFDRSYTYTAYPRTFFVPVTASVSASNGREALEDPKGGEGSFLT